MEKKNKKGILASAPAPDEGRHPVVSAGEKISDNQETLRKRPTSEQGTKELKAVHTRKKRVERTEHDGSDHFL
ncbi:MAG: hypothetical protein M3Q06_02380 [Bacteroidota bacterium]|nr:hypothetical protein [Bacteroidota bacterium]